MDKRMKILTSVLDRKWSNSYKSCVLVTRRSIYVTNGKVCIRISNGGGYNAGTYQIRKRELVLLDSEVEFPPGMRTLLNAKEYQSITIRKLSYDTFVYDTLNYVKKPLKIDNLKVIYELSGGEITVGHFPAHISTPVNFESGDMRAVTMPMAGNYS